MWPGSQSTIHLDSHTYTAAVLQALCFSTFNLKSNHFLLLWFKHTPIKPECFNLALFILFPTKCAVTQRPESKIMCKCPNTYGASCIPVFSIVLCVAVSTMINICEKPCGGTLSSTVYWDWCRKKRDSLLILTIDKKLSKTASSFLGFEQGLWMSVFSSPLFSLLFYRPGERVSKIVRVLKCVEHSAVQAVCILKW